MAERSRSRHNVRSTRNNALRIQYFPEGGRGNVYIEEEDNPSKYYVIQHPPTRDVSCQTRTNYVIQPQHKQIKHLRNDLPIGYITKEDSADKKDFQRQKYIDYNPQKYVIQRPSTRNVRCQMRTHYIIQPPPKQRKRKPTVKVVPQSDPPSPRTPTPSSDNIEVIIYYDEDFESLYPKQRKNSCQFVHYIDLRLPRDTLEPKPIEEFGRDIVSQLKKDGYLYDKVTDDGELNTMNKSMERHGPVERFCHERQRLKNSNLPEKQKKNFINQTIVYDYR